MQRLYGKGLFTANNVGMCVNNRLQPPNATLHEYSVVFTDRALNHMSPVFQEAMRDISETLKRAYGADATIILPGGGSFGMEAVARQFANNVHCLVIRNGWFSYRWSQILDIGRIAASTTVLMARAESAAPQSAFAPASIDVVVRTIAAEKPAVVFAPHVETAAGIVLPDDYLQAVATAVHAYGGLFVLDCVASGALWVNMRELGVDVLISAPQKGWSATPCAALIMLSEHASARLQETQSSSFAGDLAKWRQIMLAYESGSHGYHATMPTDALMYFRDAMRETEAAGFEAMRQAQITLGREVRSLLAEFGFRSVAAQGFEAPGVVVSYTDIDAIHSGKRFLELGLQCAAGVPLQCNEAADYKTFRIGLFGLDKLHNIERTVSRLRTALQAL